MSSRILPWSVLLGVVATIPLIQTIAVATTAARAIEIAEAKTQTPGDYFRSGIQKYRKGDFQGALADFNRAIEIDPNYAVAYYGRGFLTADKLQNIQGALADFNRAIELDANNAVVYYARAILKHEHFKEETSDISDLQEAARLYQQQGRTQDYQDAIELLKKWQQNSKN